MHLHLISAANKVGHYFIPQAYSLPGGAEVSLVFPLIGNCVRQLQSSMESNVVSEFQFQFNSTTAFNVDFGTDNSPPSLLPNS